MYLIIFHHRTPKLLQANAVAMALGPSLCMHGMVHYSSPQTEGIQSGGKACPWHGAHLNSALKPCKSKTYRLNLKKISRFMQHIPGKGKKKDGRIM